MEPTEKKWRYGSNFWVRWDDQKRGGEERTGSVDTKGYREAVWEMGASENRRAAVERSRWKQQVKAKRKQDRWKGNGVGERNGIYVTGVGRAELRTELKVWRVVWWKGDGVSRASEDMKVPKNAEAIKGRHFGLHRAGLHACNPSSLSGWGRTVTNSSSVWTV